MRNLMLVFGLCLFAAPAQSQGAPAHDRPAGVGPGTRWLRSSRCRCQGTLERITGDSPRPAWRVVAPLSRSG